MKNGRRPGTQFARRMGGALLFASLLLPVAYARPSTDGVSRFESAGATLSPYTFVRSITPARIRAAVLYRAGEFSSFRRRTPPGLSALRETAMRVPPLERRAEDEWLAYDKAQHVAFSFLWTLGTQYAAVNKGGLSEHDALPISVTSSALIGVTKEWYDLRVGPTRTFSVRDLVADAVGFVLAAGFILL